MKFAPKTELELDSMSLLEPGIYPFQVTSASNEISKSGNDMIKLTLTIWGKDGSMHFIFDYLLEAMAYKLRHFCESTNLLSKYEAGELYPGDCLDVQGNLEIIIQEGKERPDGSKYMSRNSVKDYVVKKDKVTGEVFNDDDIAF
jgi:hypothetical protein